MWPRRCFWLPTTDFGVMWSGRRAGCGWRRCIPLSTSFGATAGGRARHMLAARAEAVPGPEDAVVDRETRREVRQSLARLPHRSATVLILRHGGMSYAEIADALGIHVGQVGTRLRRAELALAKELTRGSR